MGWWGFAGSGVARVADRLLWRGGRFGVSLCGFRRGLWGLATVGGIVIFPLVIFVCRGIIVVYISKNSDIKKKGV